MHCGENGILKGAEYAVDKYENKAEQEQNELAKVDDYIQNGRETVTISKEEYNNLNLMNKPNLWEVGKEYDFGDNVYGQRYTGIYTNNTQLIGNIPNISLILNVGGMLINSTYKRPLNYCAHSKDNASLYVTNSDYCLRIYGDGTNTINSNYDVWILYTKTTD